MTSQDLITRVRVHYTKGNSLRFTGHLDLQRLWQRLLRRSRLPIRYSEGFHPRARINLASALPLGFISEAEVLDFWMDEPRNTDEIQRSLSATAPPGLEIQSVYPVALSEDALQTQMQASEFEVFFYDPQDAETLQLKVDEILAKETLIRTRRKKTYDLRPLILAITVILPEKNDVRLWMRLRAEPGSTGRPDEILDSLGFENTDFLIKRTRLILNNFDATQLR